MLYQDPQVKKVHQNGGRANDDMREDRRIDLAKVAGEETILYSISLY
jgi:hypothetical protein